MILVFWAGSFVTIEAALNRIWGATSRTFCTAAHSQSEWSDLLDYWFASSVFTFVMAALREMAGRFSPMRQIERYTLLASGSAFWQVLFAALSYLVTVALFVLVHRPCRSRSHFARHSAGRVSRGLLWEIAKYIFALSLHYFHYDQVYGSSALWSRS